MIMQDQYEIRLARLRFQTIQRTQYFDHYF